jgi:transcription antitermination factor NusG
MTLSPPTTSPPFARRICERQGAPYPQIMSTALAEPETAPADPLDIASVAGTWYLGVVKSREEKSVAERLAAAGMGVYLPTVTARQFYRRKVVDLELAACPGYLFVALERDEQYATAIYTKGVFELLPESRQARLVKQMTDLQRTIASDSFQEMDEWREGRAVRITNGHNLAGVTGWLTQTRRKDVQVVQVGYPLMGLVAVVEVDPVFVEPI